MVSDASLQKFIELYQKRYGIELSKEEAFEKASRLVNLYRAVYKPEDNKNNNKNAKEIFTKNYQK